MPNLLERHLIHLRGHALGDTSPAELGQLVDALVNEAPANGLALHFHGAPVCRTEGADQAENLVRMYRHEGIYPVFFLWESAPLDVLGRAVEAAARKKWLRRLIQRLLEFVVRSGKDTGGARGEGLPPLDNPRDVWNAADAAIDGHADAIEKYEREVIAARHRLAPGHEDTVQGEINQDAYLRKLLAADLKAVTDRSQLPVKNPDELVAFPSLDSAEPPTDGDRSLLTAYEVGFHTFEVFKQARERIATGRDHGLYGTIVEEILRTLHFDVIGQQYWKKVKGDMDGVFAEAEQWCTDRPGGTALLNCLAQRLPPERQLPLAVVGHGIGARAALSLLKSVRKRPIPCVQPRVVLLAPALDFDYYDAAFEMQSHESTALRMFGLNDQLEIKDCWFPVLYPRSLLYFVSGLLESESDQPLIGMERYHRDTPPYDSLSQPRLAASRARIAPAAVWAVANAGAGRRTSATSHRDWIHDLPTLQSICHFIRERACNE